VFLGDAVDGGVQILEVLPDGPAAKAGITSGDLVIRIDGKDVADRRDLSRAFDRHAPGDTVNVTILREGESRDLKVVLGTPRTIVTPLQPRVRVAPMPDEPTSAAALLGIGVEAVPEELRRHLGGPADAGLLVLRVAPDGLSAKALRAGDLLVSVGGKPIATEADLDRVVLDRSSGPVALVGRRSKEAFTSEVSLRLKSPEQRRREARARAIEDAIRQLEERLIELKRELESLSVAP
jgi:serine protease Do